MAFPSASRLGVIRHAQIRRGGRMYRERSAMFIPGQIRRPKPKAEKFCKVGNFVIGFLYVGKLGFSHRSGLKVSGSGYSSGSRCIALRSDQQMLSVPNEPSGSGLTIDLHGQQCLWERRNHCTHHLVLIDGGHLKWVDNGS